MNFRLTTPSTPNSTGPRIFVAYAPATLADPGEKALIVEECAGWWMPRGRADEISDFIILLTVFFVLYIVLIMSTCVSAPLLGRTMFASSPEYRTSVGYIATFGQGAASSFDTLPIKLPTYFTLIYEMGVCVQHLRARLLERERGVLFPLLCRQNAHHDRYQTRNGGHGRPCKRIVVGEKKKRAFSRAQLIWTWRIRLSQCEDGGKELRNVLIVITTVLFSAVLCVLLALLYAKTLIPTLDVVQLNVGHLVPPFSPHVQYYNVYADKHVRGAYVTVVSSTTLQFPYLHHSAAHYQHTWVDTEQRQFVSFFVRPPSDALGRTSQKDAFLRSTDSPLHFRLSTHGANAITTYRFTVVKTEAKVVSMDYTYSVAQRVDPVSVHKEINWASVLATISGQNDVVDEDNAGALAVSESDDALSCYVPHDTTTIQLSLEKQLVVYGPAQGTTIHDNNGATGPHRDNGVDWLKAQAVLHICGPNDMCEDHRGENIDVELDSRLTVVPVFLHATGGSPRPFHISIIHVSHRLIAVDLSVLLPNQEEWRTLALMPAFRPLSMSYDVYFDANSSLPPETTFFFRVTPKGDAKINYVKARFSTSDAEAFCRPPDGVLSAMERGAKADELGCGASATTKRLAELFAPTEHLVTIVEGVDMAFEKHFFVRYAVKNTQPQPWTIELDVAFKGELAGASSSTYVIHMLPQTPMSIGINVPISGRSHSALSRLWRPLC